MAKPPDPLYIFKGLMQPISCMAFKISQYTQQMYAGTESGKVHVWNLKTNREIGSFEAGNETCLSINIPNYGEDEKTVITQSKSGQICFWNEENNQWLLIKKFSLNFFGFCKCLVFQDTLYTPLVGGKCQLISLTTKKLLKTIELLDSKKLGEIMTFKVEILNNDNYMIVAYEGYKMLLWKLDTIEKVSYLLLEECPITLDFDSKTNKGICGNPTDKILIFFLNKNLDFTVEKVVSLVNPGVASVQIRPDSKIVAVGCWDGKLRIYSWKTLTLLAVLDNHLSTIQDVSFFQSNFDNTNYLSSRKSNYLLAAASKDSTISFWNLYNS